ncbi:MAG TPA: hypothetical protein VKU44_07810 [Terriglobia bacterium]|nr:hypothetical protein [Terriglobia bacterium]
MKTRFAVVTLTSCALVILLTGCKSGNQQTATQPAQPAQPAQSADQAAAGAPSGGSAGGSAAQAGAAPGQPAAGEAPAATVTVPAGTTLQVRLSSGVDSGTANEGMGFEGTLAAPLIVNGIEVARAGTRVAGEVTHAVSSGRLNRPAELALVLTSLTPEGGGPVQITTSAWSTKGESHKKRDAELMGGGAGVGALVGALAGKGKGAAIGALVGGGAGAAGAAATGKKEIVLPPESRVAFRLTSAVTLQAARP